MIAKHTFFAADFLGILLSRSCIRQCSSDAGKACCFGTTFQCCLNVVIIELNAHMLQNRSVNTIIRWTP